MFYYSDDVFEKVPVDIEKSIRIHSNGLCVLNPSDGNYCRVSGWAEEAIRPNGPMEPMDGITRVNYQLRGMPEVARLKSGFPIKELLEHFSREIRATLQPNRRLWLYSAHSTIITKMLNGLGSSEVMQ